MTVYVDDLRPWPGAGNWCHLATDGDLAELHALAAAIGLRRDWFQNRPNLPHYDLRASKREAAIEAGAMPVMRQELVRRCRRPGEHHG